VILPSGRDRRIVIETAGSHQYRAKARSQIVLRKHPDDAGIVVATHEKGSILTKAGPPFAFRRVGNAVEWVEIEENPFEQGRMSKLEEAEDMLVEMLTSQVRPVREIEEAAKAKGISIRTLKRAKDNLGVVSVKNGASWDWTIVPNIVDRHWTDQGDD
jgi:hypothetical protein